MRVLAHVLDPNGRLARAALGLEGRGHPIVWSSGDTGEGPVAIRGAPDRWRVRADVVVTDAPRPFGPAFAGWLASARCLVMALSHASVKRWGALQHWAWHELSPLGLVESAEASTFQAEPLGLALDRLGLWSDAAPSDTADPAHPDVEILERACERAIARHRSKALRPAVFLDRDGTLVPDVGYMGDPDDLELFPGVAQALRALSAAGYALVLISNQAGVGRGLFSLARAYEVMARLRSALRSEGVELDAVYLCPHRPDEGCACRKPGVALFERAVEDLHLSVRDSVMVGDKWIDVTAGQRAGAAGVLVRTGYGREDEARFEEGSRPPDAVFDDLAQAAAWILARPERS